MSTRSCGSGPGRWAPTRSETPERAGPVARLLEELSALTRAYSPGHHGRWSAGRRAELVDGCLRGLFAAAGPTEGVALVALGGYGRRELAPASDIDLLILHDGSRPGELPGLAERILYPLWDAGLTVGHAVRTPGECREAAAERLDAATALLDGRWLAGDEEAWRAARAEVVAWVRRDALGFVEGLQQAALRRRERHGSASDLLEPDLKEGGGGLRDVHSFGWVAAAVGEAPGVPTLEGVGLLRAAEREAVDRAHEFLVRARSALHLSTGRTGDRLFLEQQPQVALDLGFEDEPGLPAVDGLMRGVFEHARQVEHARDAVFDRVLRGTAATSTEVEPSPAGVLRSVAQVAEAHDVLPASLLDRIDEVPVPALVVWDDEVRDAFLRLVRSGADGVRGLETLDRIGLLVRYLPAWAAVRCRPQRDPYHRYAVDVHLLRTLDAMSEQLDGRGDRDDPLIGEAVSLIRDRRDALLLGALLHDIGKTGEGRHVAVGARVAEATVGAMGLERSTADLARFLVAEHLLLPDTATRRDLQDEDLIADVAARVGDPVRLAALYLLSVADAQATGPLAATAWRAALVRELVAKVQRVLERGEVGAGAAERLAERAEEIRRSVRDEDPAEIERFLRRVPRGYLLTVRAELAARHLALLRPPLGQLEVRTLSGEGARPGTYGLTVVAADRPGLLSLIAGGLTLAGLSILSAQAFTTADGAALDVFEVQGIFEPEVDEERWRELRTALRRAIEGRISLEERVRDKRGRYPPPRLDVPVQVTLDNGASDFFTVIEVGAPDRIGLLFDITRTFAELQLDVHLAKVATYGERVVDAFYVRDVLGRKVDDPDQASEIERALRDRIEGA